jgi:hypothetical protein
MGDTEEQAETEDEIFEDERAEVDLQAAAEKAFERYLASYDNNSEARDWNLVVLGQIKLSEALIADDDIHPHLRLAVRSPSRLQKSEQYLAEFRQRNEQIRALRRQKAELLGEDAVAEPVELVFEEPPKGDYSRLVAAAVKAYLKARLAGDRLKMDKWLRRLGEYKVQELKWTLIRLQAAHALVDASEAQLVALQQEMAQLTKGKRRKRKSG